LIPLRLPVLGAAVNTAAAFVHHIYTYYEDQKTKRFPSLPQIQGGSVMSCTYCYKGFVLPGEPKGSMVGLDYFTPAPNDAAQQSKAIILLTDVFGLPLPNPRIVADHLAEHVGVDVWVPDFFNGAFY
jgi:hypothetical protein